MGAKRLRHAKSYNPALLMDYSLIMVHPLTEDFNAHLLSNLTEKKEHTVMNMNKLFIGIIVPLLGISISNKAFAATKAIEEVAITGITVQGDYVRIDYKLPN